MPAPPHRFRSASPNLPRGRHGLPRAFVVTNQRERLIDAIAEAGVAKGYALVTVKDITDRAGVSRRTFYDLFADKEECFLAAYDTVVERTFANLQAAFAQGGPLWPQRVKAVLEALAELCVAEPAFAHLTMVDVLAAGRPALERRDAVLRRFALFLEPGRTGLPALIAADDLLPQAVIGGLYEALYARIHAGQTVELPDLVPELLYCMLVPFLGHGPALHVSAEERSRRSSGP
jgi:AcrR family transcriptional regulator